MITRILVPLDTTVIAPRVLAAAAEVAEKFGATLYLFRAILVPPEFPAAAAHATGDDPLPAHLIAEAEAELRALAQGFPRVRMAAPVVRVGDPWRVIIEASDELAIDLVVMGSHRHHWPDRILGTVAGNLANRGHCNVLIVR